MARKKLIEGIDYYYDEHGRWVFTEKYLRERGYCCKSGCKHCPYGFTVKRNLKRKDIFSQFPDFKNNNEDT